MSANDASVMIGRVRDLLRSCLQLGSRADGFTAATPLLGALPELDSMAVVTLLTAVEDEFGVSIDDDEVSADVFENLGSLAEFIARKVAG